MRKPKEKHLEKAGVYFFIAHMLLCYTITELEKSGYSYEEIESLVDLLNRTDVLRNKYDEIYFNYCQKKNFPYNPKLLYPGEDMTYIDIDYQDGPDRKTFPIEMADEYYEHKEEKEKLKTRSDLFVTSAGTSFPK